MRAADLTRMRISFPLFFPIICRLGYGLCMSIPWQSEYRVSCRSLDRAYRSFCKLSFLCTVETGNHNFNSIQISPETLPGCDAGLRRRDGVGEGTLRVMYHLLTPMIRPQALIQP